MGLDTDKPHGDSTLQYTVEKPTRRLKNSITDPVVMASTYTFNDTQAVIDYIEQNKLVVNTDVTEIRMNQS